MTTLTNVQNSLFIPDLGRFLNRRPTYELTRRPTNMREAETPEILTKRPTRTPTGAPEAQSPDEREKKQEDLSLEATHYLTVEEKSELEHPDSQTSTRFKARRTHS